jgi:hypothetical protein
MGLKKRLVGPTILRSKHIIYKPIFLFRFTVPAFLEGTYRHHRLDYGTLKEW